MSTSRTAVATAVLVLSALVAPTSVARAEEPAAPPAAGPPAGAPVTRADRVTVPADSGAEVDVLANDHDPDDVGGDDLTICRVEPSADNPFDIHASIGFDETDFDAGGHSVLYVLPHDAAPGTYTFTYYVCDYDYLTPATLTVKVIAAQNPYATKPAGRPGFVRFHNPGKRRAVIQYGSRDGRTVDGKLTLAPHTARTVRVKRHVILWTATVRMRGGTSTSGNLLGGIKQPERSPAAATTRPTARSFADRTAWRLGVRQLELRAHPGSTRRVPVTTSRDVSTDAPVTAPDRVGVPQGWFGLADVLENDSDPDGPSDDLAICRATAPAGSGLEVEPIAGDRFAILVAGKQAARASTAPVPYTLLVQAGRQTPRGSYDITYYACDHQYLTPGTVRVTVTRSEAVTARRVPNRPHVVRFRNPGSHDASVKIYDLGDAQGVGRPRPIARFKLPAHASRTVRPHARAIVWSAFSRRGQGGAGVVRGLGRPRG